MADPGQTPSTGIDLAIHDAPSLSAYASIGFFGSPTCSVGQFSVEQGGQCLPRSRRQRAMRLVVERKP